RKSEPTEVVLARLAAALRQGAGSSGDAPSVLGPKRILAVTDVVGDGRLADALAGEVYDLVPARSAVEALDLLAVQSVDCVIVDVLSQGRDGSEICRRMKSAPVVRDVPVLALLPRATREETLEVLSSGADE